MSKKKAPLDLSKVVLPPFPEEKTTVDKKLDKLLKSKIAPNIKTYMAETPASVASHNHGRKDGLPWNGHIPAWYAMWGNKCPAAGCEVVPEFKRETMKAGSTGLRVSGLSSGEKLNG